MSYNVFMRRLAEAAKIKSELIFSLCEHFGIINRTEDSSFEEE